MSLKHYISHTFWLTKAALYFSHLLILPATSCSWTADLLGSCRTFYNCNHDQFIIHVFMRLQTGRYDLDRLERVFLFLHYPSQLERYCSKGFISPSATLRRRAMRWAWEGRGSPLGDASHWWDCRWCSPADIINSGYCWDVFETYVVQKQWAAVEARCVSLTSCSCKQNLLQKHELV